MFTRIFFILVLPGIALGSIKKDTCYTGLYIKNIYDLHPENYAYSTDFWIWFDHKNQSFDPLQNVEIINAKQVAYSHRYYTNVGQNIFLASESGRATLIQNWALKNYPFDKQVFRIEIEAALDTSKMVLKASPGGIKIYKGLTLPDWDIQSFSVRNTFANYESDFGESQLHGKSTFSKLSYIITLKRQGWEVFFKLLLGLYVAFLVAFLSFFVPPSSDQRFGLSIGGLFAAVANKYITDTNIPSSAALTFVDQVHILTFVSILIILVLSLFSVKVTTNKGHQTRLKFDHTWALCILSCYILLNVLLILKANLN